MMAGMMMLLLTDRSPGCIMNSNQGKRITYQRKLVLHRTYDASGQNANKKLSVFQNAQLNHVFDKCL